MRRVSAEQTGGRLRDCCSSLFLLHCLPRIWRSPPVGSRGAIPSSRITAAVASSDPRQAAAAAARGNPVAASSSCACVYSCPVQCVALFVQGSSDARLEAPPGAGICGGGNGSRAGSSRHADGWERSKTEQHCPRLAAPGSQSQDKRAPSKGFRARAFRKNDPKGPVGQGQRAAARPAPAPD